MEIIAFVFEVGMMLAVVTGGMLAVFFAGVK